jgi:hypothetical protein
VNSQNDECLTRRGDDSGLGLTASVLGQQPALDRQTQRVISTHAFQGKFLGFCEGDYRHVGFQPKDKKAQWFFLWMRSPPGLDYFLATQKGQWVRGRYEVTDTYITEAGGRQVIEVLVDAAVEATSYGAWYKNQGPAMFGNGAVHERFEKLVRSQMVDCSGGAR